MPGRSGIRRRCLGLGLAAMVAGCGPASGPVEKTLRDYFDAVQDQDLGRLYCLMAGASEATELGDDDARRAGFETWAREHYEAYETGRDEGTVPLDEQGLTLVKLFSLGRGTFMSDVRIDRAGPDAVVVRSRIRFGYAHVDLSRFSPGTTFYVCGAPVGRVHAVRVPAGPGEVRVDVLDTVDVDWTLVRSPATAVCPEGWTVASGAPVADSATTVEVTWDF